MQRIDGPGAVATKPDLSPPANSPGYFSGGDPVRGREATMVTKDWLNAMQDEICTVIEKAGLSLDRADHTQLWQALQALFGLSPDPGGGGSVAVNGYLTEFRAFYEQTPPDGWAIRNGRLLTAADIAYPALWAALQLPQNAWKLKTETAWQALVTAAGGAGGAPYFVIDATARTIRLPDTRGDYERCAGAGTMADVGQWHGDAMQNITGNFVVDPYVLPSTPEVNGAFVGTGRVGTVQSASGANYDAYGVKFDASMVVRTASENRPRSFGVLGCVYIGLTA